MAKENHKTIYSDGETHFSKFSYYANRSVQDIFVIAQQYFPSITPKEFCQKVVDLCVAREINTLYCKGIGRQMLTFTLSTRFYTFEPIDKNGIAGTAPITQYLRSLVKEK